MRVGRGSSLTVDASPSLRGPFDYVVLRPVSLRVFGQGLEIDMEKSGRLHEKRVLLVFHDWVRLTKMSLGSLLL